MVLNSTPSSNDAAPSTRFETVNHMLEKEHLCRAGLVGKPHLGLAS